MGSSSIYDPNGDALALASPDKEALIVATIDTSVARDKKIIRGPNFWMDYMRDRRPDAYGDILKDYRQ